MKQNIEPAAQARYVVTKILVAALIVCWLAGLAGFWLAGESQSRVPSLNVQILPKEHVATEMMLDEVFERPLFWSTRRPVEELEEVAAVEQYGPPTVEPLQGVRLLGVVGGELWLTALLDVDGSIVRIQNGATVKGWRVSSITEREVKFKNQRETTTLTLERDIHQSINLEH